MAKNKYINSSGSFIGVLKRTIDKAPTRPKDKANEDFTIRLLKMLLKKALATHLQYEIY